MKRFLSWLGPVAGIAYLLIAAPVRADVNLEWRPDTAVVNVGETVLLELYVVGDTPPGQSVAAVDAILTWDPAVLSLQGSTSAGPGWLTVGFPPDGGLDGVNDTFADGDALLSAYAFLGNAVFADTNGARVATLAFEARAEAAGMPVEIPASIGTFTDTQVFDGDTPGLNVLGLRGTATIQVLACGGMDYDADGDVDLYDFAAFQACFTGAGGTAASECRCPFDTDHDDDVDLADYDTFEERFSGPQG